MLQTEDLQKYVRQQWKELKSKPDKSQFLLLQREKGAGTVLYLDCMGGYADLHRDKMAQKPPHTVPQCQLLGFDIAL